MDEARALLEGKRLKAAFKPAPNDPTATFNYSVLPLSGHGEWVVFTSDSGFGPPNQFVTAYPDRELALQRALDFAAPGGICRGDTATCLVLRLWPSA